MSIQQSQIVYLEARREHLWNVQHVTSLCPKPPSSVPAAVKGYGQKHPSQPQPNAGVADR